MDITPQTTVHDSPYEDIAHVDTPYGLCIEKEAQKPSTNIVVIKGTISVRVVVSVSVIIIQFA